MENKIIIRRAAIDDLNDILRLTEKLCDNELRNYGTDWNKGWVRQKGKEIIEAAISHKDEFVAVAQFQGKIIAFLRGGLYWEGWMAWKNGRGAELWDIFIEKDFRGRSIGRDLMEKFSDWCRGKDVDYVLVNVTLANRDAARFYERSGFKACQAIMEKRIVKNHGKEKGIT